MATRKRPSHTTPAAQHRHGQKGQWWRRKAFIIPVAVLVLLVGLRLALTPIVAWQTQKALDRIEGVTAAFDEVHLSLLDLSYRIDGLTVAEDPVVKTRAPLFQANSIELGFTWAKLIRLQLDFVAKLSGAEINWTMTAPVTEEVNEKMEAAKKSSPMTDPDQLASYLRSLTPFRIGRVEFRDGKLTITNVKGGHAPTLRFSKVEATLDNFADRPNLAEGLPTTFAGRARVQDSGMMTVFLELNPFAPKLQVSGQAELVGLQLAQLNALQAPSTGLVIKTGQFDVFLAFKIHNDAISGGVKPFLRDVKVDAAHDDFVSNLKAWAANTGVEILSDRVPGRNAVATTIPIHGSLRSPKVAILPTILGIVRNAFVLGLTESYAALPAPVAPEKQGVVTQTVHALKPEAGPPKVQPETKAK
jgi:hypothetical protein